LKPPVSAKQAKKSPTAACVGVKVFVLA
jgi:hypothetical protein